MSEGSGSGKLLLQQKGKRYAAKAGCDKRGLVERESHRVNRANACKQMGYPFSNGAIPATPHLFDRPEGNPRDEQPGQVDQSLPDRIDLMPVDQSGQGDQGRRKKKQDE